MPREVDTIEYIESLQSQLSASKEEMEDKNDIIGDLETEMERYKRICAELEEELEKYKHKCVQLADICAARTREIQEKQDTIYLLNEELDGEAKGEYTRDDDDDDDDDEEADEEANRADEEWNQEFEKYKQRGCKKLGEYEYEWQFDDWLKVEEWKLPGWKKGIDIETYKKEVAKHNEPEGFWQL